MRFLYCDNGESVTKYKVDSTGRLALNSFFSALLKAESLPSSLECTTIGWIVTRHLLHVQFSAFSIWTVAYVFSAMDCFKVHL